MPQRVPAEEPLELADLARLRQGVYRLCGSVLLYPDREWMNSLPPLAAALVEETRPLMAFAFWGDWERLLEALARLRESDRRALEEFYTGEFMLNDPEGGCSPYESVYLGPERSGWLMGELDGLYAEDGFSVSPDIHQTPDHASVQLEFMSVQCAHEAETWRREDLAGGIKRLERQKSFLERHFVRWFPLFVDRLARRHGEGFYALAADSVHACVAHDLNLIDSLLGKYKEMDRT